MFELERVAKSFAAYVEERVGVAVSGQVNEVLGGVFATVRLDDLPKPSGFSFVITNSASRVTVETHFDNFSRPVVAAMGDFDDNDEATWDSLIRAAKRDGIAVNASVNDVQLGSDLRLPHSTWTSFNLEASASVHNKSDRLNQARRVLFVAFSLVLSLLPIEEVVAETDEIDFAVGEAGEVEGRKIRTVVNRYERSRKNRAACIAIHGSACQVCQLDFGAKYGILGQGYIEVHHRLPVSLMGSAYALNPETDLIPVCSNCHRMMHREWPPIPPEELKQAMYDREKLLESANFEIPRI